MPEKKWGGTAQRPPLQPNVLASGSRDLGNDIGDRAAQRLSDCTIGTSTECKKNCADDTSRDDHVLERYHAGRVRTEVLQGFGGLNIILQHGRKSFFAR